MKKANGKYFTVVGLLMILGMPVSACVAKINPAFRGSLNTGLIAKKADFKGCYEAALKRNRQVKGDMNIILLFAPDARQAHDVQVPQTDIADDEMKQCVRQAAMSITTPKPPGVPVDAQYTVSFNFE